MTDVLDASESPTIQQFFKENNAFIPFLMAKVSAQFQIPRRSGFSIVLEALRNSDDSLLTVKDVIEIYQARDTSSVESFKNLLVKVLGVEDLKNYEGMRVDLEIVRKLCGIEGNKDPSVAFCSESSYANLMLSSSDGGFREFIEGEIIGRFTNRNSGGGLGDKTKPVVFEALQHASGKTVAEVRLSIEKTLEDSGERHSEAVRKANIFATIMTQLGGLKSENTIDKTALRRIVRIPDDGYSIKAAESAVKANLEPQAEGPAQQQASEAITTSQSQQEDYREFLKENKAFIRYTQQGGLGAIKGEGGLDVLLKCLERRGGKKSPTVGDLIFEFRTYGSRRNNETQQLQALLSKALGRQDQPCETDSTPLDLTVLKKLCGMKEGELDPSVRVCMMCGAEESYTALLSSVKQGGFGEIIANEITRLAQSSRHNQVGEKMLEIILGALPHIEGKTLGEAAQYIREFGGDNNTLGATRIKAANHLLRNGPTWWGVGPDDVFDATALCHVLGIREDGYSMAKANERIATYQQQNLLCQG